VSRRGSEGERVPLAKDRVGFFFGQERIARGEMKGYASKIRRPGKPDG